MVKRKSQTPDVHVLLQDGFSEETARQLYAQGEEIAIFVMMQLAALAKKSVEVNGPHPSEPSAAVATYLKEPGKKRKRKPGAKPGHKGSHRPPPEKITRHVEHIATCCPDCGGQRDVASRWLPASSMRSLFSGESNAVSMSNCGDAARF